MHALAWLSVALACNPVEVLLQATEGGGSLILGAAGAIGYLLRGAGGFVGGVSIGERIG